MALSQKYPELQFVTPLYHFSSDAIRLELDQGICIRQFGDHETLLFDQVMMTHLRMCEPNYLFWHHVSNDLPLDWLSKLEEPEFIDAIWEPTREWLRVLRLFNPGRLRAGETFLLIRNGESYVTRASGRASDMAVDYSRLRVRINTYTVNSAEIASLRVFRDNLLPVVRRINSLPTIELALVLYGSDDNERSDFIGAFTALEALLTKKDEKEGLTHRLSMRVANLLGYDADARRAKFLEMKRLYDLRSTMVHGSPIPAKHHDVSGALDALLETLRRVLLSVMALLSKGLKIDDLPTILDDLAFDSERRSEVQATASKFLHINAVVSNGGALPH